MEKLIVGEGSIKGTNDPVAISKSVRKVLVVWQGSTAGVGIASYVQPMTAPFFAKAWTIQKIFSEMSEPISASIGDPPIFFFWGW